jgi:predicted glycosyltransferase
LSRTSRDEYSAKSLGTTLDQTLRLRSALIQAATRDFSPDIVLIDKKPDGVQHELRETLAYLREELPATKVALVLRDILDAPEATIPTWRDKGYAKLIERFFDAVLVLGDPEIFDACREYEFSPALARMTQFCGYLRRPAPAVRDDVRERYLRPGERSLVLVTPGGGEDGFHLIDQYLGETPAIPGVRTLIVCGPEMPAEKREQVFQRAAAWPSVTVNDFSAELPALMAASDVVVSMCGYNTACEILTLGKRAVVVPRVHPVREQWIRAERLAERGWLRMIHPGELTPARMRAAVARELAGDRRMRHGLQLDAVGEVSAWVEQALPVWGRSAACSVA